MAQDELSTSTTSRFFTNNIKKIFNRVVWLTSRADESSSVFSTYFLKLKSLQDTTNSTLRSLSTTLPLAERGREEEASGHCHLAIEPDIRRDISCWIGGGRLGLITNQSHICNMIASWNWKYRMCEHTLKRQYWDNPHQSDYVSNTSHIRPVDSSIATVSANENEKWKTQLGLSLILESKNTFKMNKILQCCAERTRKNRYGWGI